jgi:predicted transcriptional regulator
MKIKKNTFLGVIILIAFLLLLLSVYFFIAAQENLGKDRFLSQNQSPRSGKYFAFCDDNSDLSTCVIQRTKEEFNDEFIRTRKPFIFEYHKYLIPLAAFIGLLFGLIVFWAMSEKEVKTKKNLISNTELILNILPETHRKIIQKLLENNGKVRQYELVHITNLNKLKIHRILRDLENNDIITKEKIGKVNTIILNKDIYNILKEESDLKK